MVNPPCLFDSVFPFHSNKTAIKELTDLLADSLFGLTVFAKGIVVRLKKNQIVCLTGLS
jgi:hypothetical protein